MTEKTIEDELRENMEAIKEREEAVEIENDDPQDKPLEEKVIEAATEKTPEPAIEIKDDAPVALSGPIKAKWKELPEDVRAEWKKREDDIHRMMTAKDGDLNFGRTIKQIATPYEAIIRAEGGTVEGAFQDLLNTAYTLRTGTPQQKAKLLADVAQQYGVDLNYLQGGQHADPMQSLYAEIQALKQQADPSRIKQELQEQLVYDKVKSEIDAFAANPKNVHYQAVKSTMGSLMASGRAANLQDAYDMAIWSDPSIRELMLKEQIAQEADKKKAEMASKKKAASSVVGSPSLTSPSNKTTPRSIEDDLRENLRAIKGKI